MVMKLTYLKKMILNINVIKIFRKIKYIYLNVFKIKIFSKYIGW